MVILMFLLFGQSMGVPFHFYGSSSYAIVGESFEFTCITTSKYMQFDHIVGGKAMYVAIIIGIYSNGSCSIPGSYNTNYTYSCYPSNYTYKMNMPGNFVTKELNGTEWWCADPAGGGHSDRIIMHMKYPDVDVALLPESPVLAKLGTPIQFKCIATIRESWKRTVFSDEILGTIATFIQTNGSCNITENVLDVYTPKCDLTVGEFMVELKNTFEWHDGHEIRCTTQYGSGNILTDENVEASTIITISNTPVLTVKPSLVHFGSNLTVTLTCKTNNKKNTIQWWRDNILIANISGEEKNRTCIQSKKQENKFSYLCNPNNRKYRLLIPPEFATYGLNGVKWTCSSGDLVRSDYVQFSITDLPTLHTPEIFSCNSSATTWITCAMHTNVINLKISAIWHHTINGQLIRALEGKKENDTFFQLQISFCSYQDMGSYSCRVTTGLIGLEELNATTEVTIQGPPVITRKRVTNSGSTLSITVEFYSNPFPEDPVWYFGNKTISTGSKYTKSTSVSKIKLNIYDEEVLVDGFISTLKIQNFGGTDIAVFRFLVRNTFSVAEEDIFTNRSDQIVQREFLETKSCSSALIGGVASGCIVGSSLITLILHLIIRKFYQARKGNTENKKQTDSSDHYDQLGMRSLPNVYDQVQN